MWDKILIMLPTYGRAHDKLPRFIDSVVETADSKGQFGIVCMVNRKDPDSYNYLRKRLQGHSLFIMQENLARPSLSTYFNDMYKATAARMQNAVASMVGDDMEFKTKGWDTRILAAINHYKGHGMFYCAGDERFNDGLCVNLFVTPEWINICGGKFMCERFHANGIDMVWQLAADATGFDRYVEDVIILHHQWSRKDVGHDATSDRLTPMRRKAVRDKRLEAHYARQIVHHIQRHFAGPVSPVVPHLQHRREGRTRIKTEELIAHRFMDATGLATPGAAE